MTTTFPDSFRIQIFNLIKGCYVATCEDLNELGDENENLKPITSTLSSDLKKLFYLYNKRQFGQQLKSLYESIYNATWNQLIVDKGWNHVCWREAFIMGQMAGVACFYIVSDYKKSLEILDQSFILGAPKDIVVPLMKHIQDLQQKSNESNCSPSPSNILPMMIEQVDKSTFPIIKDEFKIPLFDLSITSNNFETFKSNYLTPQKPCVIRGDTKDWKCMELWKDLNYFLSKYSDRLVPIELGHNRLDSLANKSEQQQEVEDWEEKIMTFSKFINEYMVPCSLEKDSSKIKSKSVGYLAQHNLIEQLPCLLDDFKNPSFLSTLESNSETNFTISPHVWFGTGNTITPLHFDSYDNFLAQIVGYKYIRLYHPNQKPNLYISTTNSNNEKSKKTAQNNISLVDIENPDFIKYPLLLEANKSYMDAILEPGDMLFLPNLYWHYVRSLSPSFSLSFWFSNK
ncbi:hypothetical protein CYY_009862 [Polysphondylium violaceum]|uniref:JmjC domain-containing protein n=1 Tax=Polysphondylium violaceum TaxID=133409 RepID=A0A8J4PST7_9MYCE|nr:hypothetical protein CYY_009862 [Polysphondylium violaceum]